MPFLSLIGILAGLHVACYGAYRDSPYETFKIIRFLREITIAFVSAICISLFTDIRSINPAILFLSFLACSRIFTETYKQFIRNEPQTIYKIPSMVHILRSVPTSTVKRFCLGSVAFSVFILIILFGLTIYHFLPRQIGGMFLGFISGMVTGVGGAYKDGFFEGFDKRKFFRSPLIGILSGFLLSYITDESFFLLLATWGMERMISEFHKGFIKSKYVPGKFNVTKANYPEFFRYRKWLVPPYAFTWLALLILFFFPPLNSL